jgi:nucleotide-binding universal stress UspA family protein
MYTHVIVGVDGDQGGRDAAAVAAMLTKRGARLSLVYVSAGGPDAGLDQEFADEDAVAATFQEELDLCGGDAHVGRVTALSVGAGIEQVAQQRGADLIVVGASHRHGITRLFAGDHVRSVIHQNPCAVAVAPRGFAQDPRILTRIGVAYDGSPESEVAVAHAGLLATERHSDVILRHVVEPHFYPPGWGMVAVPVDDPDAELEAARQRLGDADGLAVEHVYGAPRETLLEFSRSVDLLVCGSRRNGPVRRIALGSTSESLARKVDVPLLVAPSSDSPTVERWREQRHAASA